MVINTNLPALNAANRLRANNEKMAKALRDVTSGLRINSAADDASGLAVSEKMRAQIKGLEQAVRNAQDGMSLIQVAEGALAEVHEILQRMRELAIQAANDTMTSLERKSIQLEAEQLKAELDKIASTVQFNGKNLLDGSLAASASTDRLTTKVFIRDGLAGRDQFGQKTDVSGNYRIDVTATPGQGQVQKSNIFVVPLVQKLSSDSSSGTDGRLRGLAAILGPGNISTSRSLVETMDATSGNWYGTDGFPTLYNQSITPGKYASVFMDFSGLGHTFQLADLIGEGFSSTCATCNNFYSIKFVDGTGDKLTWGIGSYGRNYLLEVDINGISSGDDLVQRILDATSNTTPYYMIGHFTQYAYNDADPAKLYVFDNRVSILTNPYNLSIFDPFPRKTDGTPDYSDPDIEYERPILNSNQFYTDSGFSLLSEPQTLTLIQGNGYTADITIDSSDSIETILQKLNRAIGASPPAGLGQNSLDWITGASMTALTHDHGGSGDIVGLGGAVGAFASNYYATFVADDDIQTIKTADGMLIESVAGTIVIRSAIPGKEGEITFVGDEALLKALGLTTIVPSRESVFNISVYDAHTNELINNNATASGSLFIGAIQPGIDVKISPNSAMQVKWDNDARCFVWLPALGKESTFVHIKNGSLTLHIGANQLQDVIVSIGNISCESLGVDGVILASNTHANAALGKIDKAINTVSKMRSFLGASHNRLTHAAASLTVSAENLTSSESRIRDAEIAKSMMEYIKYEILSNSATAMLAQANSLPQQALRLLTQ